MSLFSGRLGIRDWHGYGHDNGVFERRRLSSSERDIYGRYSLKSSLDLGFIHLYEGYMERIYWRQCGDASNDLYFSVALLLS